MDETFEAYLRRVFHLPPKHAKRRRRGDQQPLAEKLHVSQSYLSRQLNGKNPPAAVEFCLRVAFHSGRPPQEVLRAAGRDEVAVLLESVLPRASKQHVSNAEFALIVKLRELSEKQRAFIDDTVTTLFAAGHATKPGGAA